MKIRLRKIWRRLHGSGTDGRRPRRPRRLRVCLIEDPKPAGCEPTDQESGYGDGFGRRELRDERTAFFAAALDRGKHAVRYRLRAETPVLFHALPASAECLYAAPVRGASAGRTITVAE
ncbi:MAG: hypothetical protein ACRC1K_17085 [Planctomycetia bacterium]